MRTIKATAIVVCLAWIQTACVSEDTTPSAKPAQPTPSAKPAQAAPVPLTLAGDAEPGLRVSAHWERIAEGLYNIHAEHPETFDYAPAEPVREYASEDFRAFLPEGPVTVGAVWNLDPAGFDPILRQFHPGATTSLRRGKPGAFACLRALSQSHAEIVFRIHGEIELVAQEVYLTLSQFTGHVLIDRATGRVARFFLEVPDRNTNADVNAYRLADIVYIPRMELAGGDESLRESIAWADAISHAEASKRLARSFYEFEKIAWEDLETAIGKAESEERPLHAVVLFGVLEDESC